MREKGANRFVLTAVNDLTQIDGRSDIVLDPCPIS